MIKAILLAGILLITSVLSADTLKATWDTPTTRVGGSPLPAEDIVSYNLKYSVDGTTPVNLIISATGSNEATIIANVGSYEFSIATMTEDITGPYSDPITVVVDAIIEAEPTAPNNINMTIQCSPEGCTLQLN